MMHGQQNVKSKETKSTYQPIFVGNKTKQKKNETPLLSRAEQYNNDTLFAVRSYDTV